MSVQIIANILNCGPYFVGSERATFIALANFSDQDGRCWPSVDGLSFTSGVSARQVQRNLLSLEKIRMVGRTIEGGRRSNRYEINLDALEALAARLNAHKASAKQAGRDRYQAVSIEARRLRAEDDAAAEAFPSLESFAATDNADAGGVTPCHPSGESDVGAGVTPCHPWGDTSVGGGVTPCHPSGDIACHPNLQRTYQITFTEPAEVTPEPPPDKRAALRERLARIDRAAQAIGVDERRMKSMVFGVPDQEAQIERWVAGDLTADELRIAVLAAGEVGLGNGAERPISLDAMNARELVAHAIVKAGSITFTGMPVIATCKPNRAERAAA